MTAHLAIVQAVVDALLVAPAVAGGRVWANRMRPIGAGSSSGVVVRLESSRAAVQQLTGAPTDWQTDIRIECIARGAAGAADPADAVDTLLQSVWARIAPLYPPSLGVLNLRLDPVIGWQFDGDGDTLLAAAEIGLQVMHRTESSTLAPRN